MSYEIITDSCCDFPAEMYQQQNVRMVPLRVSFRDNEYDDRNDDSIRELYDGLRAGEVSRTSAVNPQRWEQAMEEVLREGKDVLVLAFSSGLSTTYQSAMIAAQELQDRYSHRSIFVVDTLCASMGQGLLVWYACRKRDAGMSLEQLRDWVEKNKEHVCHWFTVDDLMYLKRGGRVSAATALVGTMLQIKPVLHVDAQGHLVNMAKARGRKAAMELLVRKLEELGQGYDNDTVFISHGDCREDAALLAQMVRTQCGVKNVVIGYIGAVIGSHAGPGTLALFFLGSQR